MSPIRGDHQVYYDNMILRGHGTPQWVADPDGNQSLEPGGMVEIGDVGYMDKEIGQFVRIKNILSFIGFPEPTINRHWRQLGAPECAGELKRVKTQGEGGAGTGLDQIGITALSAGAGFRLDCTRGEGALLNLESGGAHFRYCDKKTKARIGEYMRTHYRSWLDGYGDELAPDDLFLVTGTFMTGNWEAATFVTKSTSIGGHASVEALSTEGKILINWQSRSLNSGGFISGHTHAGRDHTGHPLPNHNTVPSFGAVCHCSPTLENQCIFLRGWRIREMARFPSLALVMSISAESMKSHNLRNIQFVKLSSSRSSVTNSGSLTTSSTSRSVPSSVSELLGSTTDSFSSPLDARLEEAPGTSTNSGCFDHFDLLAIHNQQNGVADDMMLIHDDDLIDFLYGAGSSQLIPPQPLVSELSSHPSLTGLITHFNASQQRITSARPDIDTYYVPRGPRLLRTTQVSACVGDSGNMDEEKGGKTGAKGK